ncbi:ABC transporter permease [Streptomyces europaeiscabiei]|uniref:ABC transporter permease n=1 Tax=Streptomyces europaeiscabiei TaxID=146819 RepID=UPI0007658C70|nr:ABC transporter permease [Streptomyces europaeiscabiei]MDX2524690.1 ABC transporter permease [Streptomyces europaeiscabiei]MDX2761029.1 ABC transporter permease [Streptomyces europaeiscabiei]MDX2770814.1 ABC transporter permease [Streptomyces europaeiscabiei]MDX3715823.1 ABC transporter permease [Streptomyces europaeiscabiei]MDX3783495.1 ABC transporter permease [Streptomyces europaeiscabiei]
MKLISDTWLVFSRQMLLVLRNPVWLIVGLLQPLCFLFLFGPLLGPVLRGGDSYQTFVPGLLVNMAMLGTLFAGFGLIADLRAGVLERMRVTPVSPLSLLLGRSAREVLTLLVQSAMITLLALPLGLRIRLADFLLTYALLALIAVMLSAASYALALKLRSEDALTPLLNTLVMPLLLLSGILLPMALAPDWLHAVARLNPFLWAVDASRALFNGHPGDASVWQALVILTVLTSAAVAWAARSFARSLG